MFELISKKARRLHGRVGTKGVIEGICYPVLVPIFTTVAWMRSLWVSRILLLGQWGRYHGFHPLYALNSFFYKTQWLNLDRFGQHGSSPVIGLGDYPLSRWFHLSMLSSCLYANAGAATTLLGTLVWAALNLMWLDSAPANWVITVSLIAFFSSTAFAMAFTIQNYNILGWMWFPLALFAVFNGHWALAALTWLAASLASVTVIFAAAPLMLLFAIATAQYEPILALLPAVMKLALNGFPMMLDGGLTSATISIARMIGLTSRGVRYKRTSMRLSQLNIYLIGLYATGCGLLWLGQGHFPTLPAAALILFGVNQRLMRFADDQSVILLFISVYVGWLIFGPPNVTGLVGLVLVANPLPLYLGLCSLNRDRTLVRTQVRHPFDHSSLQSGIEQFLSPVPAGSRVYFAFEDPDGVYERVFDGYRNLLELPLYVASKRGVHLFPDWHAVSETNYQGAPNCWGRSLEGVTDNLHRWQASYAVVYQDSGTALDSKWMDAGYREVARFDWGDRLDELQGYELWSARNPPCWWLLAHHSENHGITDVPLAAMTGD